MAGGKSGSKRKKTVDERELKEVQAWVAEGLALDDDGSLASFVADKCKGSSSRLVLQGALYLLLKRWPPKGSPDNQQLREQLLLLAPKAVQQFTAAAAAGQKPSLVLAWAAFHGLNKAYELLRGQEQQQALEQIIAALAPLTTNPDPQRWLEQWQLADYPSAAEVEAAKNPQALAAAWGFEVVSALWAAQLRAKQDLGPAVMPLKSALQAMAAGKEVPKDEAGKSKDKAAAAKDKDKAKEAKAALQQQLERSSPPSKQQQQQQGKRTKDTDKARDALRGKAGDDKAAQEVTEHREVVKLAQQKAEEVLQFLSSRPGGAELSALQSQVAVDPAKLKDAFLNLGKTPQAKTGSKAEQTRDAYDNYRFNMVDRLMKAQLGLGWGTEGAWKQVEGQLQQATSHGRWLVFAEGEEAQKELREAPKAEQASKTLFFTSLDDFEQHACSTYLDSSLAANDLKLYGLEHPDLGPGLLQAYQLDFGDKLADDAAAALAAHSSRADGGDQQANGFHTEDNQWLQAFSQECPLRRYLHYVNCTVKLGHDISNSAVVALPELAADLLAPQARASVACGFALLQLQRGQVLVSVADLSRTPAWQVKAYQCLKMLPPLFNQSVSADRLDVILYNYYVEAAGEAVQEVGQMIDPDLFIAAQAGSADTASSSSSPEASFSDGLVQDTVTLLQMLHDGSCLAQGALPLALQVWACKVRGRPLPLPRKHKSSLKRPELMAALEECERQQLLELRCFLLQVVCENFARLSKYREFLSAVAQERWKARYVPVQPVQEAGKEGKLVLTQEYYNQACMTAAVPYEENEACCNKHICMRVLAEADGHTFSRFATDSADESGCVDAPMTSSSEREQQVERYLLKTAQVLQAQQEQGLQPGTQQGLQALTRELFLPSEHQEVVLQTETPPGAPRRGGWELCRFYLLLSSQLAIHREQLQVIITEHEKLLTRARNSHSSSSKELREAERALLQQRIAGVYYCQGAWTKWYERTAQQLREQVEKESKPKGAAQEKAGKGAKEASTQEGKDKPTLDQLHEELEKASSSINQLQNANRELLKQSQLDAAGADAAHTSMTDANSGLSKALELVMRQLLNARPATLEMAQSSLAKALSLSRLSLFELDVLVMQYASQAHMVALTNMWRFRQPAAALGLVQYELAKHLVLQITEQRMDLLLMEEEESTKKAAAKAAGSKAAGSKAASKKKAKKKGPATQVKKVSLPASDHEASDEEKQEDEEEAADAAAAAADSEGEEAAEQDAPPAPFIDPAFLRGYEELQQQPSSRQGTAGGAAAAAAAATAAAEAGPAKPAARGGQQAQDRGRNQQQQQGKPHQQQQQQGKPAAAPRAGGSGSRKRGEFELRSGVWYGTGPIGECVFLAQDGLVCCKCGDIGHAPAQCSTPHCSQCQCFGHASGECSQACRSCRYIHALDAPHKLPCGNCKLFGHMVRTCPQTQCHFCLRYGHRSGDCPKCRDCGQDHQRGLACCFKCKKLGHRGAACKTTQCSICSRWGTCVPGSCTQEEEAKASSSSGKKAQQQQQQAPPPPAATTTSSSSSSRVAAGRPPVPPPQSVALLSLEQAAGTSGDYKNELWEKLLALDPENPYGGQLFNEECWLLQVPQDVMYTWLQQPDWQKYLEAVMPRIAAVNAAAAAAAVAASSSSATQGREDHHQQQQQQRRQQEGQQERTVVPPWDLPPAAVEAFERHLPAGAVPSDWHTSSWKQVESMALGPPARCQFGMFRAAKRAALEAAGVAAAAPDGRRSSSGGTGSTATVQEQQQQQQRLSQEPSGPRDSSGGESEAHRAAGEGAAGQPPVQQAQPQQGQPTSLQALLLARKTAIQQQQQQVGVLPGALPQQLHPAAAVNSYSAPNPHVLQQQQLQVPAPGLLLPCHPDVAREEARIRREPLQPWMLWYHMGAARAIEELPPGPEKQQLLRVLHEQGMQGSSTFTHLPAVNNQLLLVLVHLKQQPEQNHMMAAGMQLAKLMRAALDEGPPAQLQQQAQQQQQQQAAAPATPSMLPPHLRMRPNLPPHLAGGVGVPQPQLQQQQQQYHQPPQQQQQQEEAGEESEEDMDDMLASLVKNDASPADPAAALQQQQPAAGGAAMGGWAEVTGHAVDDDDGPSADFPPLGASAEDADMAAALAASRADAQSSKPSTVPGVSVAGLANQTGEYNCFLNVVVQCLWSCKAFTQQVATMERTYMHQVVKALVALFRQMEAAEAGWQPGRERAVINPTDLRIALAEHTRFKCQEMNDANELLDTIHECFAQSQNPGQYAGTRGVLIDGVFGLLLSEKVVCSSCGMETHQIQSHFEYLIMVNTTSFSVAAMADPGAHMDSLLRTLIQQDHKYCDKDKGGCGAQNPLFRKLERGPQVLTLQLVWSQQVSSSEIMDALSHVEEDLDITSMYEELDWEGTTFRLTSAVAYYGQHYMAFVFTPKLNTWVMFDDASVSSVGSWQDVIRKCGAGKIQPGVLFYQLVDLSSLPDVGPRPAAAHHQQQQPAPVPVAVHRISSSSGGPYGTPGAAQHSGGYAAAAPAAAPAASGSSLPASAGWGRAAAAAPRVVPQSPAVLAGPGGGDAGRAAVAVSRIAAAAGLDDADMAGDSWGADAAPSLAESGEEWPQPSSSGSFGSSTGPAAAGGAGGRVSSGRSALGPAALRDLKAQGVQSTGPRSAGAGSVNPRLAAAAAVGGAAGPGGMDRSGSSGSGSGSGMGGYGGRGGGEPRPVGRVGGRGAGRGVDDAEGWSGRVAGRGAGPRGRAGRGY